MLNGLKNRPLNKQTINDIINFVDGKQEVFDELVETFLSNNTRVSQLTSWAVGHITEQHPQLVDKHHKLLIANLQSRAAHNAVRRNIVRIYQTAHIPEDIEGELSEICYKYVANPKEVTAIRVFSMTICERIAIKYPELVPELIDTIQGHLAYGSAGFKNRGSKILNKLQNLAQ